MVTIFHMPGGETVRLEGETDCPTCRKWGEHQVHMGRGGHSADCRAMALYRRQDDYGASQQRLA